MSFRTWLQNLRSALAPRSRQFKPAHRGCRRAITHRLLVEPLEDRSLPALLAPVDYSIGAEPRSMVAADFNNDNVPDLAVGADGEIRMLLGNGDGSFRPGPVSVTGLGSSIISLAVGDFDRDGNLDLATADGYWGSVLTGRGDGSFGPSLGIFGEQSVESVAVGDFNGDGFLDLGMVSTYRDDYLNTGVDGSAELMLGNGDGTFDLEARVVILGWATGFYGAVAADLNGDNIDDFVTSSYYSYPGANDGARVVFGSGTGNFQVGFLTTGTEDSLGPVATGDLDGDGNIDLVRTGSAKGKTLHVVLNNGDGWFDAPASYETSGGASRSLVLGDFTGDGHLDVAQAIQQKLSVFPGVGDGTLAPRIDYDVSHSYPLNGALVAADFNGDGWLDAAITDIAEHTVSVLLNDQSWQSPPPPPAYSISIADASPVTEGNSGTRTASFIVTLSAASSQPVTVAYLTANGTATAGSDYQTASGTLTFAPGETSKTITVPVLGDRLAEANETFTVNLSSPTNATIADGQGAGTITDDEPRISISDVSKKEGRRGKTLFTFTVTLSAAYDQAVTMSFQTVNGTATTADGDFVAKSGTITFAPGETTKTITIEVKGDWKKEATEYFYLDLSDNSSNSWFTKNRGTGTILNDD